MKPVCEYGSCPEVADFKVTWRRTGLVNYFCRHHLSRDHHRHGTVTELHHTDKEEDMSEYRENWQVGDMAWIHTDGVGVSRGDTVKVTRVDGGHGIPFRGVSCHMEIKNAYRVLRKGEKMPDGTVLVRVGNFWDMYGSVNRAGTEGVVGVDVHRFPAANAWAIKSMPTVDPEREERLKRIENMERELAELKKLDEDR